MRKFLLLAGAAALLGTAPTVAKPGGGHGYGHAAAPKSAKAIKTAHVAKLKTARVAKVRATRLDRNRNGILDADEALAHRYGGALCPPGLWKKTPSCIPPGQAKRLFREGQRINPNYKYYTPYGSIPTVLVDRYDLTDQNRYIYRNNVIYVVDPTTDLVTRIINAVL